MLVEVVLGQLSEVKPVLADVLSFEPLTDCLNGVLTFIDDCAFSVVMGEQNQ